MKKSEIKRNIAKDILLELQKNKLFDCVETKYLSDTQRLNYLFKKFESYFRSGNKNFLSWNKNTYLEIFDDKSVVDALVYYMTDYNLSKELENENK